MEVARHVRVFVDGEYVAKEVASAVLSPVVLVMAFWAAASTDQSTLLEAQTVACKQRSCKSMLPPTKHHHGSRLTQTNTIARGRWGMARGRMGGGGGVGGGGSQVYSRHDSCDKFSC